MSRRLGMGIAMVCALVAIACWWWRREPLVVAAAPSTPHAAAPLDLPAALPDAPPAGAPTP